MSSNIFHVRCFSMLTWKKDSHVSLRYVKPIRPHSPSSRGIRQIKRRDSQKNIGHYLLLVSPETISNSFDSLGISSIPGGARSRTSGTTQRPKDVTRPGFDIHWIPRGHLLIAAKSPPSGSVFLRFPRRFRGNTHTCKLHHRLKGSKL